MTFQSYKYATKYGNIKILVGENTDSLIKIKISTITKQNVRKSCQKFMLLLNMKLWIYLIIEVFDKWRQTMSTIVKRK